MYKNIHSSIVSSAPPKDLGTPQIPTCSRTDELWRIHTMELYAPRTKDLTIAAYSTDDSQKPVVERSQTQKNIYSSIPFVEVQNQTILLFWLIYVVTQQREAKKSSP